MIKLYIPNAIEIFSFYFMDFTNLFSLDEHPEHLERLSSPQPDFRHINYTFSNALLLHRLVATCKGDQVVRRRGELNRDLVKRTCTRGSFSKVRCRVRLGLGLETTLVRSL